jgi:hypothetical protein
MICSWEWYCFAKVLILGLSGMGEGKSKELRGRTTSLSHHRGSTILLESFEWFGVHGVQCSKNGVAIETLEQEHLLS